MRIPSAAPTILILAGLGSVVGCAADDGIEQKPSGCDATTWYRDVDGDGHGDVDGPYEACEAPPGHVADASDCDDQDPSRSPSADESCNGRDDNCDGRVDEDMVDGSSMFYADTDADGYGDPEQRVEACSAPDGFVENSLDCDDSDPTINPDGSDAPRDGVDGDCDGSDATSLSERAYVGDLTLLSEADIDAFCADFDGVVGDVQLAGAGLPATVALDCLLEVTGDMVISADETTTVSMAQLWWVGGELRVAGNPALSALNVSMLRFVDGGLVLLDNGSLGVPDFSLLESVGELARVDGGSFPVLEAVVGNLALAEGMTLNAVEVVGGSIAIRDGALRDVSLPSLRSSGPLDLRSVSARSLVLDSLEEASSITVELPAMTTDLSLPALRAVDGELEVEVPVVSVSAARLESVGGVLRISDGSIESIELPMLSDVGADMWLGGASLSTVRLDAIAEVGGGLDLTCPRCAAVHLDVLWTVGGDLSLQLGLPLGVLSADSLESITGGMALTGAHRLFGLSLPALTTVGEDVVVQELEYLELLELPSLADPGGLVDIAELPALQQVDLSGLTLGDIAGQVVVRGNPELRDLALGPLSREAGSLAIEDNPLLETVDLSGLVSIGALRLAGEMTTVGLESLESTTGAVVLSLDAVSDLDLDALEVVGGDLELTGVFATIELSSLERVGGRLTLSAMNATDLAMPSLLEIFTDFTVELNGARSVDLSALRSVGGSAQFLRASDLESLELPLLESVGTLTFESLATTSSLTASSLSGTTGSIEWVECDGLATLDGFGSLTDVGASLNIVGNDQLVDVSGLAGIETIGGNVRIEDNRALSTSAAETLIEVDIGESNVGGGILITGNAL